MTPEGRGYTLPEPPHIAPVTTLDPALALDTVRTIYNASTSYLRECFRLFAEGRRFNGRAHATYPYAQITVSSAARKDTRLAYGFVETPGTFRTTLTRPDIFDQYYLEQFTQLIRAHGQPLEIGMSRRAIPIHFAFPEGLHLEDGLDPVYLGTMRDYFDLPDLEQMDDNIVNGTFVERPGEPKPMALFTGPRVDFSLQRLRHYSATASEHFQNFIIFTNYQFYVDEFVRLGLELMTDSDDPAIRQERSGYCAFVEPGDFVTPNANLPEGKRPPLNRGLRLSRMPQMPAYHLQRPDGSGITMVNIGVGPSNAKTITDHIAVLRPHAWLMLGHCAGLRTTQRLGDYVLAHGYVREDHVLDADLPPWVPVPPLAEVQVALEHAVELVTGLGGMDLKRIMRTGTVATIDDRNWELREHREQVQRFNQSRAVALDMESATIAANGFRFRVPYGTLLCVSDKPLHGEIKLPGMADHFYRKQVDQHLKIGLHAMELLREMGMERLHSRKLRSFNEVAFQ